ncbi:hypothetical protein ACVWXM_001270 [Bradyrhizobium sp. GM7.3]
MDRDSKSRAVTNILITGGSQAWKLTAGFVLTIFSTRNLAPSDFGLLAMSATAATFLGLIKDVGIGQAIIQRTEIAKGQIDALFWLSVLASAASALVLALCAHPAALFYGDTRLQQLMIAIAGLSFIAGLPTVPAALLARESRFKPLAILDVGATTASVAAGIVAVIILRDYWALYLSSLVVTLISTVGIWAYSGYRPGYPHLDSETRHMARFGLHVSGFNLANYLSRNADNILIGKFRGGDELGLYDRAYKLLLLPIIQLHNPIGQVIVPLLSRLRFEKERYLSTYNDALSMVMLICQPGIVFAILLSEPLFRVLLGEHWVGAAPIFSLAWRCGLDSGRDRDGSLAIPQSRPWQGVLQARRLDRPDQRDLIPHRSSLGRAWNRRGVYAGELQHRAAALRDIDRSSWPGDDNEPDQDDCPALDRLWRCGGRHKHCDHLIGWKLLRWAGYAAGACLCIISPPHDLLRGETGTGETRIAQRFSKGKGL